MLVKGNFSKNTTIIPLINDGGTLFGPLKISGIRHLDFLDRRKLAEFRNLEIMHMIEKYK